MKATATLILFLCSFWVFSQRISGNCRNGFGKYQFENGVYEGNFTNNQPNGKGVLVYDNGDKYEGDFLNGQRHGKGVLYFADKQIYEGDFKNDEKTGKGTYKWLDGKVYEGEFLKGKRHGDGVLKYPNGATLSGFFSDDKLPSYGTMITASGDKYIGQFVDGVRTGKGIAIWINGDKYEGDFLNNKRTGHGELKYANGNYYWGDFLEGDLTGQGHFVWSNGDIYDGELYKGLPHGVGIKIIQKEWIKGEWSEGKLIKRLNNPEVMASENSNNRNQLESTYNSSSCLEGDCSNGFGKYLTQYSDVYDTYDMNFSVESTSDIGRPAVKKPNVNYEVGYKYEGDFVDGKFSGQGKMYDQSGNLQFEGIWNYGVLITSQRINVDSPKKKAYLNKKAEEERKIQANQNSSKPQSHQQNEKVGEQILNNEKPQQQPKEEKLIIEPAPIGSVWINDDGKLTKTDTNTFTFKWRNEDDVTITEYLILKNCEDDERITIMLTLEKLKKCQYEIKGNSDRKAELNWFRDGFVEVSLYDDFGKLMFQSLLKK